MNKRVQTGQRFEDEIFDLVKVFRAKDVECLTNLKVHSNLLKKDTEVDLLVITSSKIYVIEAKSSRREIVGNYDDGVWKVSSSKEFVNYIYNPVYQNVTHTQAIKSILRRKGINFTHKDVLSYVCVRDTCKVESDVMNIITPAKLALKIGKGGFGNKFNPSEIKMILIKESN